jgi:hypothetical protein
MGTMESHLVRKFIAVKTFNQICIILKHIKPDWLQLIDILEKTKYLLTYNG